jgi:phasin family protein
MNFAASQQLAFGPRRVPLQSSASPAPAVSLSGAGMSTHIPQQLVDAQTASTRQVFSFSSRAFEGFEKLAALNLQVIKATLAENQALAMKALSARPDELVALSASLVKPTAEKVAAYSRHVREILSDVQGGLSSTVRSQVQQHQQDANGFVENLTKQAATGTYIALTE